jgi:hypothetical protein
MAGPISPAGLGRPSNPKLGALFLPKEINMARKQFTSKIGTEVKGTIAASPVTPVAKTITPVRNSAIPKLPVKKEVTREQIAEKAYYISISGQGGSEMDNWLRAERELKA